MPELIIQSAHICMCQCEESLWDVETLTLSTKSTDSSFVEKLSNYLSFLTCEGVAKM